MLAAVLVLVGAFLVGGRPAGAAVVTLPDMQIKVPTNLISAGVDPGTGHKMLRFTHVTWDAGTGPFEIDPTYNPSTGTASFVQSIYNSQNPGHWSFDHSVPLATIGVFDPPDDYQFPLTSFTLNVPNADGTPGAVVATSPKNEYCITGDVFVGGVPNAPSQTSPPQSNCTDPTKPLGWSVGWGDQYDQTDAGQPIDLTGIADGTYVLHATVDPQHLLTESNTSNNVTDTTIRIAGTAVTVVSQTQPGNNPPSVAVTNPQANANVSGTVSLQADASAAAPASIASVQFLLDGQPLGAPLTTAPYNYSWTVGSTALGGHTINARATDSNGIVATSPGVPINVVSSNPGLSVDRSVSARGTGAATTTAFSTSGSNETLVAFVSSDGASGGGQSATVSGAGLTWSLVARANTRPGDAEIWTATAPSQLSNVTVTSSLTQSYSVQLTLLAFVSSAGKGASATAAATTGAPTIILTTRAAGSLSYAVGNDWDTATPRTLGPGQSLVSEWSNTTSGDDLWVQATNTTTTSANQAVTLNDTAPVADQWNLAAVEVTSASSPPPPPPDTTPPTVSITNPTANQTVSGNVPVAANASDDFAVASVQFLLDGQPLGSAVTTAPYSTSWNTTTASAGTHNLSAQAKDTSGNIGTSSTVPVVVQTQAPPMTCFVLQAQVSAHAHGTATTPSFSTAAAGETLVAFVAADGPRGSGRQTVTVTGAGLTWTLVKRANAQSGDSEIWTAKAPAVLANATVRSAPLRNGFDQDLTVIAMEGTGGVGASAVASAPTGAPSLKLTTTKAASLVFAVGNDWDRAVARTLPTGWVSLDQWVDSGSGDTFWSQYTNQTTGAVGTVVTVNATAPTNDQWNLAAVELIGDDS
jgi:hypothetical protein